MSTKEYTRVTSQAPPNAGWISLHFGDITNVEVTNRTSDLGRIIARFDTDNGNSVSLGFSPEMFDVLLQAVVAAVGATPRLSIADKLDAAAAVDDNGEAFGKTLNDFITALGAQR